MSSTLASDEKARIARGNRGSVADFEPQAQSVDGVLTRDRET